MATAEELTTELTSLQERGGTTNKLEQMNKTDLRRYGNDLSDFSRKLQEDLTLELNAAQLDDPKISTLKRIQTKIRGLTESYDHRNSWSYTFGLERSKKPTEDVSQPSPQDKQNLLALIEQEKSKDKSRTQRRSLSQVSFKPKPYF